MFKTAEKGKIEYEGKRKKCKSIFLLYPKT